MLSGSRECRRIDRLLLAIAALIACAIPVNAKADNLIVPGVRIGAVRLGMSVSAVYDALGEPSSSNEMGAGRVARGTGHIYSYSDPVLDITTDDATSIVIRIDTRDAKFATAQGIRVGDSELSVRARLGAPKKREDLGLLLLYDYNGMSIIFNRGITPGKVFAISIPN